MGLWAAISVLMHYSLPNDLQLLMPYNLTLSMYSFYTSENEGLVEWQLSDAWRTGQGWSKWSFSFQDRNVQLCKVKVDLGIERLACEPGNLSRENCERL